MKVDTDRILSITAILVAAGSLIAVSYQAYLMRQAQHASVLPYLYVGLQSNEQGVHLMLSNTGIGPALVNEVRVHYQGQDFVEDPYDFYLTQHPGAGKRVDVDRVAPGRLIPAGASVAMVGAKPDADTLKDMLHLFDLADVPDSWYANADTSRKGKAIIEVTFSSVYGERWRIRSDRAVPTAE